MRNSVQKELASDVRKSSIHLDGSNWKNLPFVEKLFTSSRLNFLPINNAISIWKHCNSSGLRYFAFMMIGAVMTMDIRFWQKGRLVHGCRAG